MMEALRRFEQRSESGPRDMLAIALPLITDSEAQSTGHPITFLWCVSSGKCSSSGLAARSSGTIPGAVEGKRMDLGNRGTGRRAADQLLTPEWHVA